MLESAPAHRLGPELLVAINSLHHRRAAPALRDWKSGGGGDRKPHHLSGATALSLTEPWLNWIIGLLAVLDAGAMQMALCPRRRRADASAAYGFTMFNRLAASLATRSIPTPIPTRRSRCPTRSSQRRRQVESHRLPTERSAEEAWPHFRAADQLREFGLPSCGLLHGAPRAVVGHPA